MGAFQSCLDAGQRADRKKAALQVSSGFRPEFAHERICVPCQAGTMASEGRWQWMGLHRVTQKMEFCTHRVTLLKTSALEKMRRSGHCQPPFVSFVRNVSMAKEGLSKGSSQVPGCSQSEADCDTWMT